MPKFVSIDEFLNVSDCPALIFESKVWGATTNPDTGVVETGKMQYRQATVADKEAARQAAKKGKDGAVDNATFGCTLVAMCLIEPKVSLMDVERLKGRNAKEMERLLNAICGETDPK